VPLLVNQTPFLLCCVVDGFCPSGLEFHGVLPHVLQPPLVLLLSFSAVFGESSPPPCLCCVVNGLFPSGLKPSSAFLCVLEPPLVLLLSLGAAFSELNPLFFLFVVLLMIFFLVVLSFLVLFLVFSMSFGVVPHPWYYF